jgi:hypothetical protein
MRFRKQFLVMGVSVWLCGFAALVATATTGCGTKKAYVPVDSPLAPWQPPAQEEKTEPDDAAPKGAEAPAAPGGQGN